MLVGVRIDPAAHLILSYETVLTRAGSMQNLLRPVLEEYAEDAANRPAMKTLLATDSEYQETLSAQFRNPRKKQI